MKKYDLIVIGGGFSGCAAAIAAARCGMNVLLAEKSNAPGGAANNCLVNPFMPYRTNIDGKTVDLSAGFFKEITDELAECGAFKDKKTARTIKILIVVITLLLMSTFVLPMLIGGVAGDARGGNTNASEQFRLIITNPFRYAKVLVKFFLLEGPKLFISVKSLSNPSYASSYIGNILEFTSLVFYLLFVYVLFSNRVEEKYLKVKTKVLYGLMYLLIFALISTALYL